VIGCGFDSVDKEKEKVEKPVEKWGEKVEKPEGV